MTSAQLDIGVLGVLCIVLSFYDRTALVREWNFKVWTCPGPEPNLGLVLSGEKLITTPPPNWIGNIPHVVIQL
jgi:hypothetical protein